MKATGVGLGMIGGMALAVTAMNAIYPDVAADEAGRQAGRKSDPEKPIAQMKKAPSLRSGRRSFFYLDGDGILS